jgi:kumamolisin
MPTRKEARGRPPGSPLPRIAILLLVLVLCAGFLTAHLMQLLTHAARVGGPIVFHGTVSPLVAHSSLKGAADANQRISLAIGLRPRNLDALKNYVQDIERPGSINYHRFLTPAQVAGAFGPSSATYDALRQYLQASGFRITHTYSHHLLIAFTATISQVEQAFHVRINNYTAPGGHTFYANDRDPLLPASLVGSIQSITGLNNASHWHRSSMSIGGIAGRGADQSAVGAINRPLRVSATNVSCPGHGNGYLTPDQTASAYNLNGLYNANYHGEGQTVALFELDSFVMSDLTTYASCYGHSHTPISAIFTGSNPISTDDGVVEVELDAELILSAAPQLGLLKIYEAANDFADYNAEWAQIIQDAPPIVSTSWGQCEETLGQDEALQEDVYFIVAAAQGQSIFAASGDDGSTGCASSDPSLATDLSPDDPAAQPYITGVGGTFLSLKNGTSYGSEITWNDSEQNLPLGSSGGGASGGGISQYWMSPLWQNAPGVHNTFSTGTPCNAPGSLICREVPDVSLNADPLSGYVIYCSSTAAGCSSTGGWYSVGGTSAAAPMWAAMLAMTNQMSLKTGGFNLGFLNPLLYQAASNNVTYTGSFHDITIGTNDFKHVNNGDYPATPNYDLATGLGSYNAFALATNLVTLSKAATGQRASPTSTTWYFAEGSVGGGFQEYLTLQNPSPTLDATVSITYLFQSRAAVTITHTVAKSSRATINVNLDLNIKTTDKQEPISAIVKVTSGPGIVAERPMYFNFKGIQSGTDVIGATIPGTSYFFAEADTIATNSATYYTYITVLNPSSTQTATTTLTFYTGSCGQAGQPACVTQTVVTPPLHRGTGSPLGVPINHQMAIKVVSDQPVVVERPMYFKDVIPTAGGTTTGAASEVGATAPGIDWLFAEGYTGTNFQETMVLANFAATATTAHIKLEYSNGHTQTYNVAVPAFGQTYFDVKNANAHPIGTCDITPCQVTTTSSAEITSDAPIVADRLMFFHYGSGKFSGGTDAVGEPGPASHSVYAFAEGYTANTFQEYLTLQNPTDTDETVAVTLFADTYVMQEQVLVKAHSRQTLSINALIVPIVQANVNMGNNSYSVSMSVQAIGAGAKIVAERPMYFNYYGDQGGTDVIGYTG